MLTIELQGITTGGWMLAARVSFSVKYIYAEKFKLEAHYVMLESFL